LILTLWKRDLLERRYGDPIVDDELPQRIWMDAGAFDHLQQQVGLSSLFSSAGGTPMESLSAATYLLVVLPWVLGMVGHVTGSKQFGEML
jgi:hypothetical protein